MNILVVEDDDLKFDEIHKHLISICKKLVIARSSCVFDAKTKMIESYYDVLILDINLPLELNGECSNSSGFDLFQEISNINAYKKPHDIVFLTSYELLHEKYREEIGKKLFSIMKYSNSSNEWKESLKQLIEHIMKAASDSGRKEFNNHYAIAIITAVDIEFNAVRDALINVTEVKIPGDPTIYYSGEYKLLPDKKIIFCMQHQMGIAASSVLTIKLIDNFSPMVLGMVGIAAGKRGEGSLGDIIVPTEVWDYGSGKYVTGGGNEDNSVFLPDPKYISLEVELKELINKNYSNLLKGIYDDYEFKKPDHQLSLIKGPLATGSAVVQDDSIIKKFIDPYNRKLKGLDMEAYGVFYATENYRKIKPKLLICKSICDFADKEKNDNYQSYASYSSVAFFLRFVHENRDSLL